MKPRRRTVEYPSTENINKVLAMGADAAESLQKPELVGNNLRRSQSIGSKKSEASKGSKQYLEAGSKNASNENEISSEVES